MSAFLRTLSRLRALFFKRPLDAELENEMASHLELAIDENQKRGLSPAEARRQALIRFGGVEQAKERHRDARGFPVLDGVLQDLRYSIRQLRKNPGFACTAIITLSLSIGANTAIFSVINAALLRPLPFDRPEQLVNISTLHLNGNPMVVSPDFKAWQEQSGVLDSIGAFGFGFSGISRGANLTGIGEPAHIHPVPVTVGLFPMLGVQPILGRGFSPEEGQAGHNHVALLSGTIWKREFGGDRNVVNRTIHLEGSPYTIIGVMPAGMLYPPGDMWVPEVLDASNSLPQSADWPMLFVIGRLKPGVSRAKARDALQVLSHRLDSQFSSGRRTARSRWHVEIVPLRQLLVGDVGYLLLVLLAAVGFVLLIACANLANLLLARAAVRAREVAVRAALGASRGRLMRQFLAESVLLASFGGLLGTFLGLWAESAMQELIPPELPADVTLDHRLLVFVICISVIAVILFGSAPALAASRVDVNEGLKEGGAASGLGRQTHYLRGLLVVAETALALILLSGAGLLARSFIRLSEVNLGFDPHHLLLADVYLPTTLMDDTKRQAVFFHEVLDRLRVVPGVESVAATTHYPVTVFNALAGGVQISGRPSPAQDRPVSLAYVSPDYFRTMRIRLLKGRPFNDQDSAATQHVVILNESEARNSFPGGDPIGHEISVDGAKGPWRLVVGVASDTRNDTLAREPWPEIYIPYQQDPSLYMALVLRSKGDPMGLAAGLPRSIASVDFNVPVSQIETMDEVVQKLVAPTRFKLVLLGSFAMLALVLGAVGLYGVVSYAVTERTHEIGIRLALGAGRNDILKLVVGQGLKLAFIGVGFGLLGAMGLTRFLSSLLYGVKPTDPLTLLAVSLILIFIAFLASFIPARRAARVDPMVALRHE